MNEYINETNQKSIRNLLRQDDLELRRYAAAIADGYHNLSREEINLFRQKNLALGDPLCASCSRPTRGTYGKDGPPVCLLCYLSEEFCPEYPKDNP